MITNVDTNYIKFYRELRVSKGKANYLVLFCYKSFMNMEIFYITVVPINILKVVKPV